MRSVPTYILVLTGFLVLSLMIVALAFVWFPEAVSAQTFVKVGASFAVLILGSVAFSLLGRGMAGSHDGEGGGRESKNDASKAEDSLSDA